jgi:hypothetical protein
MSNPHNSGPHVPFHNGHSANFMDLSSVKHHLIEKLAAAEDSNNRHRNRAVELSEQIKSLQDQSDLIMTGLETERNGLLKENDKIFEESDRLPSIEFLREQLDLLKRARPGVGFEDMNPDPFVELGILDRGEGMDLLTDRIATLIDRWNTANARKRSRTTFPVDEESRRLLLFQEFSSGVNRKRERNRDKLLREMDEISANSEELLLFDAHKTVHDYKPRPVNPTSFRPICHA